MYAYQSEYETDHEDEDGVKTKKKAIRVHAHYGACVQNVEVKAKTAQLWVMERCSGVPGFQCRDLPNGRTSYIKKVPVGSIITPLDEVRVDLPTGRISGDATSIDWVVVNAMLDSWVEWHAGQPGAVKYTIN